MEEFITPAKLFKVKAFFLNFNAEIDQEELPILLSNDCLHLSRVVSIQEADLRWTDDHELNQQSATIKQFQSYLGSEPKTQAEEEVARLRVENARLKRIIDKMEKV